MKKSPRNGVIAVILTPTAAPILAGCVVVPGPGWHHGYWVHDRWYR